MSKATKGKKFDDDKPRLDLLTPEFLEDMARVLSHGAKKYNEDEKATSANWRKGMRWGRLIASAQRHMLAFQRGEDIDPESGIPHLSHAACSLMFLHYYTLSGQYAELDDRVKPPRDEIDYGLLYRRPIVRGNFSLAPDAAVYQGKIDVDSSAYEPLDDPDPEMERMIRDADGDQLPQPPETVPLENE